MNGKRRGGRGAWTRCFAFACGVLATSAGAGEFDLREEPPKRWLEAPPCRPVDLVSTVGWRRQEGWLLPRGFRIEPGPGVEKLGVRQPLLTSPRAVASGGDQLFLTSEEGFPEAATCRTTLAERDVLILRREHGERIELIAWTFDERVSDGLGRELGWLDVLGTPAAADEPVLWTILRARHEPFPVRGTRGAIATDLDERACPVRLALEPIPEENVPLEAGAWLSSWYEARLENRGARDVTLVAPGDGSSDGERTPRVWLEVHLDGRRVIWWNLRASCGNMNPLEPEELIHLPPGHAHLLGSLWAGEEADRAGVYVVRAHYINDPAMKWYMEEEQDPALLARVRASTPCELVSNPVRIVVTPEHVRANRR